ncbi:hypothetical protein BpHYR1_027772 [Brachionus plicatilis]|uniref:Uncharacterized protein n=1 Tax=Brachionus plicatilis TaxID=10195 RepID=A0A3M7PQY7_BRAPC|nr:hypothetical protein BpHYR1_027772 [Brachionus plicatilis]
MLASVFYFFKFTFYIAFKAFIEINNKTNAYHVNQRQIVKYIEHNSIIIFPKIINLPTKTNDLIKFLHQI